MSKSKSKGGSKSSGGGSNVDRPAGAGGRSVEINGRTVTDPKQVERIERNREASARYAVDAYQREGAPIPPHLRETVNNQIARGDYSSGGGSRNQGSSVVDRSPRPIPRGTPVSSPNFFQRAGDFLQGTRPLVGMGGVINSEGSLLRPSGPGPSPGPSPGPNVYAGLGQPGMAREDTPPLGAMPGTIPESSPSPGSARPGSAPPVDPGFVYATPANFNPVLASDVAVNPASQFTFEQYLAQLQGGPGAMPPPITPLAPVSMNPLVPMPTLSLQGIGSLPAAQPVLANMPLRIV